MVDVVKRSDLGTHRRLRKRASKSLDFVIFDGRETKQNTDAVLKHRSRSTYPPHTKIDTRLRSNASLVNNNVFFRLP